MGAVGIYCIGNAVYSTLELATYNSNKSTIFESDSESINLGGIASQYNLLSCHEAMIEMEKQTNKSGKRVHLWFPNESFIGCDRYPNHAISFNGNHYGYLYEGKVYCNVYPEGLPLDVWVDQFYVASGISPEVKVY